MNDAHSSGQRCMHWQIGFASAKSTVAQSGNQRTRQLPSCLASVQACVLETRSIWRPPLTPVIATLPKAAAKHVHAHRQQRRRHYPSPALLGVRQCSCTGTASSTFHCPSTSLHRCSNQRRLFLRRTPLVCVMFRRYSFILPCIPTHKHIQAPPPPANQSPQQPPSLVLGQHCPYRQIISE